MAALHKLSDEIQIVFVVGGSEQVQRQWMCADGLQTHFLALDTSYADL
jgi:hypothetical protein